jgi:hypothetical protein
MGKIGRNQNEEKTGMVSSTGRRNTTKPICK